LPAAGYLYYCGDDLATSKGWTTALEVYNRVTVYGSDRVWLIHAYDTVYAR
jgi:hypothetical protein